MLKIGYVVSEFPGQTHSFFWREVRALRELSAEVNLVSTRRPPPGIISHVWSREAISQTTYLSPPGARGLSAALKELRRAAPAGLARAAQAIADAEGLSPLGRARLAGLALMGSSLAALARERGLTHVHAHSCGDSAHVAMFAHLISGIPYSITLHGPLSDYGPNQRAKWRNARFAIVITEKLRREVEAALAGSLPPAVEVAPMGVEVDRFARSAPYEPWSGEGPLRIFSCGRLNPIKGHRFTIRAVEVLRSRGIDARLVIGGEDEAGGTAYHRVIAAHVEAARLEDAVELAGAISEERVQHELSRAHVFCLASLNEPLGVAIMEAMSMCVPVVVTDAGGVPELVDDGADGLLVPPQDALALAAGIERVARDPALARRLGESARRKVVRSFDSTRSAALLVDLIEGAAPAPRRGKGGVNGLANGASRRAARRPVPRY